MKKWTTDNMSSQKGKVFLITGANSGTDFGATRALAQKGGKVIMAVRNLGKGEAAMAEVLKETPHASIELMQLDLADLISVDKFSNEFAMKHQKFNNQENTGLPSAELIASQLNLSAKYLSDCLKQFTCQGVQQHIHEKLIEKAKEQLGSTDLTVAEITFHLGFDYPQSFNKLFKSKTNVSPLAYRKSLS